jgi:hypothetical protein
MLLGFQYLMVVALAFYALSLIGLRAVRRDTPAEATKPAMEAAT